MRLRLGGADGPVEAGPSHIDITGLRESAQQPQQCPWVDIVVVIHVAEPPVGMGEDTSESGAGHI